jgi:hypothetical protein
LGCGDETANPISRKTVQIVLVSKYKGKKHLVSKNVKTKDRVGIQD